MGIWSHWVAIACGLLIVSQQLLPCNAILIPIDAAIDDGAECRRYFDGKRVLTDCPIQYSRMTFVKLKEYCTLGENLVEFAPKHHRMYPKIYTRCLKIDQFDIQHRNPFVRF